MDYGAINAPQRHELQENHADMKTAEGISTITALANTGQLSELDLERVAGGSAIVVTALAAAATAAVTIGATAGSAYASAQHPGVFDQMFDQISSGW
jgi:hypothetical protein